MIVIDKDSNGNVQVTEGGVTETLFPNIDDIGGSGGSGGAGVAPLFPLVNGTHTFSNGVTVTVTNGHHVVIVLPEELSSDAYINFYDVTENTADAHALDNLQNKTKKFTIEGGKSGIFGIYNYPHSNDTSFNTYGTETTNIGLPINRLSVASGFVTKYFASDTDVGCFFFVTKHKGTYEFDVMFYVDNIKYVGE